MTDKTAKQKTIPEKEGPSKACRYFKKGFCGLDDKCSYKHTGPRSKSGVECHFYKKASCKFASKCWNKHVPPNGKVYPKPGPLNKFIVVSPSGEEPEKIEDSSEKIKRGFKKPENLDPVSKNCFYYEKKGICRYEDKCWYSHSVPYALPADELLHEENPGAELELDPDYTKMCYNFIFTECEFGDECPYVHGDICPFCDLPFLHPFDEKQRREHLEACEIFFLEDMDNAFKFMDSKDKMCAICFGYVWDEDQPLTKQLFGILENCNHFFCLHCIRRWRKVEMKKGHPLHCPMCRRETAVVVPSTRWFVNNDEKLQWVTDYKAATAKKTCKFYAKGRCKREGNCPFNHSGITPEGSRYQMPHTGEYWERSESSGQHERSDDLAAEGVAADRDQDAGWRDLPEQQQDAGWRDLPEQQQGAGSQDLPKQQQSAGLQDLPEQQQGTGLQDLPEQQQDAGLQDLQEPESWDDTPPVDQASVDLQSGKQDENQLDGSFGQVNVVGNDEQNAEGQIEQDLDICGDTPENQLHEDSLLQSSENISSETSAQQFDDNLEQADIDEKQDEENQVVEQDPDVSLDTP